MKKYGVNIKSGVLTEYEAQVGEVLIKGLSDFSEYLFEDEKEIFFEDKWEAKSFSQYTLWWNYETLISLKPDCGMNEKLGLPSDFLEKVCEVRTIDEKTMTIYPHAIVNEDYYVITDLRTYEKKNFKIDNIEDIEILGRTTEIEQLMEDHFYDEEVHDFKVVEDFLAQNPPKLIYLQEQLDEFMSDFATRTNSKSELPFNLGITIDKELNINSCRYWSIYPLNLEEHGEKELALEEELKSRIHRIESKLFNYSDNDFGFKINRRGDWKFNWNEVVGLPISELKLTAETLHEILSELTEFISRKSYIQFEVE